LTGYIIISHEFLVEHINCHVQRENLVTFLDFRIAQISVATYCRWCGNLCGVYIAYGIDNFLTNQLVK